MIKLILHKNTLTKGDCYELKITDNLYVYFQFIDKDAPQLNSDCIRFFKQTRQTLIRDVSEFEDILISGTWFYSHTYVEAAVKKKLYRKIGNFSLPDMEEVDSIKFHSSLEFPNASEGENEYWIRKLNQPLEESTVSEDTYRSKKNGTWHDGVMGPFAFRERILLKLQNSNYEYL